MTALPASRWNRWLVLALLLVALPAIATAQDTKLSGTVTDAETGAPIPGATVVIVGTQQGAATDSEGQYVILGLNPATYAVRVSFVGYTPQVIENVLVTSGRTTALDVALVTGTIQGEEVVVEAQQLVVDRNQTTSRSLVTGEEIARLPVTDLQDVVSRTANSYDGFLRGSRRFEAKTVIEGVDVSDAFYALTPTSTNAGGFSGLNYNNTNKASQTNASLFSINPDIVSEVTVNTGATDARYTTGSGGVVAISLDEGGGPIRGNATVRIAPQINRPGPDTLAFYTREGAETYLAIRDQLLSDPATEARGRLFTWTEDKYAASEDPEVDLRFNVGGSITDRWTFVGSGQWFQTNGFQPNEFRRRVGGTLKSTYQVARNSRVSGLFIVEDQGLWGNWNNRSYQDFWRYYLEGVAQDDGGAYLGSLRWSQILSPTSLLEAQVYRTYKRTRYGYVDDDGNGFTDPGEDGDFLDFRDAEVIANYIGPAQAGLMFATNYSNPYSDITGFRQENFTLKAAQPTPYSEDALNTVTGFKADYSNQLTPNHFIQAGLDLKLRTIEFDQIYGIDGDGAKLNGVDGDGNVLEPYVPNSFSRNPYEIALYAADRMEYGGLIVNLGLRVEFVNRDMEKIADYYYPFQRDTVIVDGRALARNNFRRSGSVPMDVFLNPRLGVSHPIGERAAMYFSYARNQQLPPFTQLYEWYEGNHSTNRFFVYQNPEQDPITSNNYELGVQWEFAEGWGADINAYMRSIDNYGQIVFQATHRVPEGETAPAGLPTLHSWATSFGYAEARGIELVVRRRPLQLAQDLTLGLTGSYTYSSVEQARSTGGTTTTFADNDPDNPTTELPFEIADEIQNYPQNVRGGASTLTGGYDRRHRATLRAVADIPYDFSVGLTSSFESGFLYESLFRDDQRDRSLSTGPANFQADLRLEKRISFADRYGVDLYVDLVNLTNRHNVIAFNRNELSEEALAFETTGNPGKRLVQRDGSVLYGPARSVYFGARVRF